LAGHDKYDKTIQTFDRFWWARQIRQKVGVGNVLVIILWSVNAPDIRLSVDASIPVYLVHNIIDVVFFNAILGAHHVYWVAQRGRAGAGGIGAQVGAETYVISSTLNNLTKSDFKINPDL
jgi:hypothetical protein